jgi:ParB family transcriptional regulator, chromosome partitioning protein
MSKKPIDGSSMNAYKVDPDNLVVVGIDTNDGPEHPLYDERIELPIDPMMVENIIALGVREPVIVRKNKESGEPEVVDGRRRVLHAREANKMLKEQGKDELQIPVIISTDSEEKVIGMSISLNELRLQDTMMTKARKAARLTERGMSDEEVGVYFGVTRVAIGQWKKLLSLSKKVQKLINDGKVSATAAAKLADLEGEEQEKAIEEILSEGSKVSSRSIKKKRADKDDKAVAPNKRRMKKLVDQWQSYESEISEDFIRGVRWASGDLSERSIKGLSALIDAEPDAEEEAAQ